MTTDVHETLELEVALPRMNLVWACAIILFAIAAITPFLPPRSMTDATGEIQ